MQTPLPDVAIENIGFGFFHEITAKDFDTPQVCPVTAADPATGTLSVSVRGGSWHTKGEESSFDIDGCSTTCELWESMTEEAYLEG